MIKIYPSRLEGEPLEEHETLSTTSMREWLKEHAPNCDSSILTLHKNGKPAAIDDEFDPVDTIEVWIEPRGIETVIAVAVVAVAVSVAMRPKAPKQRDPIAQGQGLKTASLTGNTVRFGEPIPEIFGAPPRIYPDYLLPPRTYYSSPRIQWVEAFLCVGKGEYQKDIADVYVGDTRAPSMGDDVQVTFYEPGEDLTAEPVADWWHTPKEVGFTSRGAAGMDLGTITDRTPSVSASSFTAAGDIISIASGADFPEDWGPGTELKIIVPYPTTIRIGAHDIIESEHAFSHFTPTYNQLVELGGDESGIYRVNSYTPPSGTVPAVPGSPARFVGSDAPVRLNFDEYPAGFTIHAPGGTYSVYLGSEYATPAALLLAIQSQLNSTSVSADMDDGVLIIEERSSPYKGGSITLSGASAAIEDVFGDDPTSFPGVKTEAAKPYGRAQLTLQTLDDYPAIYLEKGELQVAVAPAGMLYTVTQRVSDRALKVAGPDWAPITSGEISVTLAAGSQSTGWTGPFSVTPPGELCDAFEIDLQFPGGLMSTYNKKARNEEQDMGVFVSWRKLGEDDWNEDLHMHTDMTADALGFTIRKELPEPAEIEVRLRTDRKPDDTDKYYTIRSAVQWVGLRGRMLNRPEKYEGITTMAVRLRTGDRVSSQADSKVWLKATRILPLLEGGEGPTRDLAPALLHVLSSCGYGDRVDIDALTELHEIWQEREDRFDYAAASHSTVKRLSNDILRAGFAELVIDHGLLTPVRDALRDNYNYIYSPQELLDYPTITTEMIKPDDIDGVDAEYIDEHTGKPETVKFRLFEEPGRRAEKIKLIGVTNWTKAWRIAARHRRTIAYRRTSFKGTTELQALNSSYMSYDRMQDGVPEYGQSCFVVDVSGLIIRVSEKLDFDGNEHRGAALRRQDGTVTQPFWVRPGPDEYSLQMLEPLEFEFNWVFGASVAEPTMLYFGGIKMWAHDILVTSISPKKDNTVDIHAVIYDERVYADDDRDPTREVYLTSKKYETINLTSPLYPIEAEDEMKVFGRAPRVGDGVHAKDVMGVMMLPPVITRQDSVRYIDYTGRAEWLSMEFLPPVVVRENKVRYLDYDNGNPEALSVGFLEPVVLWKKHPVYDIPPEALSVTFLAPEIKREAK